MFSTPPAASFCAPTCARSKPSQASTLLLQCYACSTLESIPRSGLHGESECLHHSGVLAQVSRGLLPDTGSEYEGDGGNINDALEFLLLNFTEMNKLWVRMQHQGSGKDRSAPLLYAVRVVNNECIPYSYDRHTQECHAAGRDRKEGERQQLADLVGKNLTYISQLEGLDFKLYKVYSFPLYVIDALRFTLSCTVAESPCCS